MKKLGTVSDIASTNKIHRPFNKLSDKDVDGPLYLVSTLVFVRMNVACESTTHCSGVKNACSCLQIGQAFI